MPRNREYHIDNETRTALQTKTGVRFLLRTKLKAESRHSSDVTRAVAEAAGHQLTHFAIQLNVIQLLSHRLYALICYDLFLYKYDEEVRSQFSQNPYQPIHEIIKRGNSCHVIRSKRLDDIVANEYKRRQECDNGPRPYFADSLYPPLYVDGRRVERSKDGTRDPDEPEGWDWERRWVFGPEEDELKGGGEEE
ncbi:uncharacterized protein P884DRAFT_281330 [Thermothelomyces heterothallicus CBS 202.75]|uniref:uncharacterized protein n=1 Tax=Thermothelomyces heterothallicus CBS 202.75 TaxID=1149848 RepID=UPI003742A114